MSHLQIIIIFIRELKVSFSSQLFITLHSIISIILLHRTKQNQYKWVVAILKE